MSSTQARSEMSRLDVIRLLAVSMLLLLPATAKAQQSPPIAEQIAKAYGLDSFGKSSNPLHLECGVSRWQSFSHMEWSPKTDTVSYEGKDKEANPSRRAISARSSLAKAMPSRRDIDPAFANDQYWLLLPFHLVWTGAAVTDDGMQKLPLGDASAQRVVMKYPSEGGLPARRHLGTLYWHRTNGSRRWSTPGSPNPPHLVMATYADYKKAGPLLISTDHRGTVDGKPLHLSLSDVSVKLTGSDNWINAQ